MGLNLLVQFSLHRTGRKEVSQEASGFHEERHAELLSPGG
jgi:hypothetical protein